MKTITDQELKIQHNPKELLTILVVEDNLVNMLLAKAILKKILPDARILEAETGARAVQMFEVERPSIVLMDVRMPDQNGYDTTLKIRSLERDEHIPIIALTAGIAPGELERCLKAGMNDYIFKPILLSKVKSMLEKWLPLKDQDTTINPTS